MYRNRSFCIVVLESREEKYGPGDVIKGEVVCNFVKPLKVRGIEVRLEAAEKIEWFTEARVWNENLRQYVTEIQHVKGYNKVLYSVISLAKKGTYEAGEYKYPFSFRLPEKLPSTYSGSYGYIRYDVTSVVDKPFALDLKHNVAIKVESLINLNEIPWLNPGPICYTTSKTLRWLFSSLGTVDMNVYLEKAALIPGDMTKLKIELKNSSSETILGVAVNLLRFVVTHCNNRINKPKEERDVLKAACSSTEVGPSQTKTYTFNLDVPKYCEVLNLYGCSLFKQWTQLDIIAVISGIHTNLKLTIPIKLGHLPYEEDRNQIQRAYSASSFNFLFEQSSETVEENEEPSTSSNSLDVHSASSEVSCSSNVPQ